MFWYTGTHVLVLYMYTDYYYHGTCMYTVGRWYTFDIEENIDLPGTYRYNCLSFFPFHSRWAPSLSTRERIFPHRFPCHVDSFSAFGYDWVVFVPTQPFGTTTAKMHRSFVGYFAPFRYCVPFFTGGKQLVNGFGIRFVLVLSKDGGSFIQYPFGFDRIVPSSPCAKYGAIQAQHSSSGYMYVAGHGLWYNKHSRHQLVQNNETPGLARTTTTGRSSDTILKT